MTTNDLNQSKEINFNDLVVEEGLGKYKKIFNKKEIENVILNFMCYLIFLDSTWNKYKIK